MNCDAHRNPRSLLVLFAALALLQGVFCAVDCSKINQKTNCNSKAECSWCGLRNACRGKNAVCNKPCNELGKTSCGSSNRDDCKWCGRQSKCIGENNWSKADCVTPCYERSFNEAGCKNDPDCFWCGSRTQYQCMRKLDIASCDSTCQSNADCGSCLAHGGGGKCKFCRTQPNSPRSCVPIGASSCQSNTRVTNCTTLGCGINNFCRSCLRDDKCKFCVTSSSLISDSVQQYSYRCVGKTSTACTAAKVTSCAADGVPVTSGTVPGAVTVAGNGDDFSRVPPPPTLYPTMHPTYPSPPPTLRQPPAIAPPPLPTIPPASQTKDDEDEDGGGLSSTAVALIIVASICALLLCALAVLFALKLMMTPDAAQRAGAGGGKQMVEITSRRGASRRSHHSRAASRTNLARGSRTSRYGGGPAGPPPQQVAYGDATAWGATPTTAWAGAGYYGGQDPGTFAGAQTFNQNIYANAANAQTEYFRR